MTKEELLTAGEQYTDLNGYKGDDKEIAACSYMLGAMWMQEKLIEKVRKDLDGLNNAFKFAHEIGLPADGIDVEAVMKSLLNENKE